MNEPEFATKFGKWIKENKPKHHQNYEHKVAKGGTFNLKQWRLKQPHQPRSLKQASGSVGIYHKISDMSRGQKPFDAFFSVNTENYLVIWFDKYGEFFIILIQDVPIMDSISYNYCRLNFKVNRLLINKKKYEDEYNSDNSSSNDFSSNRFGL